MQLLTWTYLLDDASSKSDLKLQLYETLEFQNWSESGVPVPEGEKVG